MSGELKEEKKFITDYETSDYGKQKDKNSSMQSLFKSFLEKYRQKVRYVLGKEASIMAFFDPQICDLCKDQRWAPNTEATYITYLLWSIGTTKSALNKGSRVFFPV